MLGKHSPSTNYNPVFVSALFVTVAVATVGHLAHEALIRPAGANDWLWSTVFALDAMQAPLPVVGVFFLLLARTPIAWRVGFTAAAMLLGWVGGMLNPFFFQGVTLGARPALVDFESTFDIRVLLGQIFNLLIALIIVMFLQLLFGWRVKWNDQPAGEPPRLSIGSILVVTALAGAAVAVVKLQFSFTNAAFPTDLYSFVEHVGFVWLIYLVIFLSALWTLLRFRHLAVAIVIACIAPLLGVAGFSFHEGVRNFTDNWTNTYYIACLFFAISFTLWLPMLIVRFSNARIVAGVEER